MKPWSTPRGFLRIATLMAVGVAALVLLTSEGLKTLSGIRAFSSGAAHWIQAEKEVIHHLARYVRSPNRVDWAISESYLEVLRASRDIGTITPDTDAEEELFLEMAQRMGHTPRDAERLLKTPDLVWRLPPMQKPMAIWLASDSLVGELEAVARAVGPPEVAMPPGTAPDTDTLSALSTLAEIDLTSDALLGEFTAQLSRADHMIRLIILGIVVVSGFLLLAITLTFTYRTLGEVERSEQARELTEARLQMLVKQTPILIWTVDRTLTLRTIDGGGSDDLNPLVGRKLSAILDSTTRNERALRAHEAALTGRSSHYETRWRDRTYSVHVEPLRDYPGAITGAVSVALDVTARAEAEEERARLEEQLREAQKMEAVGQLAGGIAHDFNNLLTVVQGNATLLQLEGPNGTEELTEIRRAAEKAQRLIRQLLAFSRREAARPRVLELGGLITEMQEMLRSAVGEAVALSVHLDQDVGPVRADPGQLEQVLLNLALNARDAMPEGGELRIAVRPVTTRGGEPIPGGPTEVDPGSYAHLAMTDEGQGIGETDLPRIFEPFFSTKHPSKGSGLGLAMVYGVVKQAEGFVWAESEPDRGTTIHILLPTVEAEAAPSQSRATPDRISSTS